MATETAPPTPAPATAAQKDEELALGFVAAMDMDIKTLTIDQAIIHEITERRLAPSAPAELLLSNALSPLDDDLAGYFQARIAESLRRAAYPVVADPDRSAPTPELVYQHLVGGGSPSLVDTSQAMAQHLFDAEQRVNASPGLLVVTTGTLDTGPCLAILKLKKQEGLNLARVGSAGAETYSMEHLRRLMLTNDTRVFKVALFDATDVTDVEDVTGLVSDKQQFASPEKRMADFFLKTFLGCRLRDDPAQITSRFYVASERFINDAVSDPEQRAIYHRALLTELTSQSDTINPKAFADQFLDQAHRASFVAHIRAEGITTPRIARDTILIENRLREEEYLLDSGIRVRGKPEAFENHTDISQDGDLLEMIIRDRLKSVKGAPGRKRSN